MAEELKREPEAQNPVQPEVNNQEAPAEDTGLPESQEPMTISVAVPTAVTMWNDPKMMNL